MLRNLVAETCYQTVRITNKFLFMVLMPRKRALGTLDRIVYRMLVKLVLIERRIQVAIS